MGFASLRSVLDAGPHALLIARAFRVALDRLPDDGAFRSFGRMLAEGGDVLALCEALVGSPDFQDRHGPPAPVDAPFLLGLFRFGFRRDPDDDELRWLNRLRIPDNDRAATLARMVTAPELATGLDLLAEIYHRGVPLDDDLAYKLWLDRHAARLSETLAPAALPSGPLLSLLLAVGPVRPDLLAETVRSLAAQSCSGWELVLALAPALPRRVRAAADALAADHPAVRVVAVPAAEPPGTTEALLQTALLEAGGTFVGVVEPGDRLAPGAVAAVAAALERRPALDLLFTDEDMVDGLGERSGARFKPGWGPDLLLGGDRLGQLAVLRRSRALAAGGFRPGSAPSCRYDLMRRGATGLSPAAVAHLPGILFHRGRRSRAVESSGSPVNEAVLPPGAVLLHEPWPDGTWPSVRHPLPEPPPAVSVLICTRDQPALLGRCVDGLLNRTDYPGTLEILIADNGSEQPVMRQLLDALAADGRVRVLHEPGPFNWSVLNNRLAAEARGEALLLLNDDVDVLHAGWLDEMVRQLSRPEVGIVGAHLLYPDGSLQHGGVVLRPLRAYHLLRSAPFAAPGHGGQLRVARDLQAVTGACLLIGREAFEAVGGLDPSFEVTCNDIDLCLRVREQGFRVIWTPYARLQHLDGASRGRDAVSPERLERAYGEMRRLYARWGGAMDSDPFLNPFLVATDFTLMLADPPPRPRSLAGAGSPS